MVSYFPSTLESIQKFKFEANKIINSKAFLCQEDITKLNGDAIVNSASKTLIGKQVLVSLFMNLQAQDW